MIKHAQYVKSRLQNKEFLLAIGKMVGEISNFIINLVYFMLYNSELKGLSCTVE